MPTVADYPHRDWSADWGLDFGPLYFEPAPATPIPQAPVSGAKGGSPRVLGDARPGNNVRRIP